MTWRRTITFAASYALSCAICGFIGGQIAVWLGISGWWQ